MTRKTTFLIAAFVILVSAFPSHAQQAGKVYRIGYLTRDFAERVEDRTVVG